MFTSCSRRDLRFFDRRSIAKARKPFDVEPGHEFAVDQRIRTKRAISQAIYRLDGEALVRCFVGRDAAPRRQFRKHLLAAVRLAGFGPAYLYDAPAGGRRPEIVIKLMTPKTSAFERFNACAISATAAGSM